RYPVEDVEALRLRQSLRRHPERTAPQALHFGAPVLESALTLVEGGRLFYRGRDAVELARMESFERVAALLWTGDAGSAEQLFFSSSAEPLTAELSTSSYAAAGLGLGPVERCQAGLPRLCDADAAAWDLRPTAVPATGARILRAMACWMAGAGCLADTAIAATLAAAWAPGRLDAPRALEAALILCADHELNVSAFTARCVASADATPYDVVCAGLAALRGRRHGGYTARVAALLREVTDPSQAAPTLVDRLRRGEDVPGFGHSLYPQGDPRASELLGIAHRVALPGSRLEVLEAVVEAASSILGEEPTLDVGLVALETALELPAGSALALFALGRTAGWIAHAVEEYSGDRLIRPRARYVGPAPGS
ncbi:MAG: hypothetical protein KDD11_02495, partial [Acidobacteria bacterium]|nr:hypothetical protein [Acidobacteriota bacterium]